MATGIQQTEKHRNNITNRIKQPIQRKIINYTFT